jgi:hypothetical protein
MTNAELILLITSVGFDAAMKMYELSQRGAEPVTPDEVASLRSFVNLHRYGSYDPTLPAKT